MWRPLRRASVFLRQRAREWTVTGFLMIKPSFTNLRICWPVAQIQFSLDQQWASLMDPHHKSTKNALSDPQKWLTGVGIGNLIGLVGVEPHLLLATAQDAGGQALLEPEHATWKKTYVTLCFARSTTYTVINILWLSFLTLHMLLCTYDKKYQ